MRAGLMIICKIRKEDALEMPLVEHDDVVKAFTADRSNDSLDVRSLPGRSWRRDDFFDIHVLDALAECRTVDAVAVTDHEARRFVIRKRLDNLLACPTGS